ncbi:MAG: 4-hydroxy-tetrahydrodipicolinate synthase [Lachnospiraceae bacterium]|nr:4-hydroxy-tetrahydrodipicolinate synthase [Lachnospiraceae bacterium]
MAIFKGSGVALVTPFKENLDVDYEKLEELVEYHIKNSSDALIVCGTTGEASTLTEEEHLECIKVAVKKAAKRIPVIAGTGSNDTKTAVYLSKEAADAGADGILVVTPYYNKATQKGLIEHYTDIAKAVDVPMILYNVPGRTGCNIKPETAVKLAREVDNIVGIKEASGNISQVAELAKLAEGCIDIYSGNDDQVVPILSLGGIGVISVLANVAPKETHDMVYKFLEGDVKGSLSLQLKYLDVISSLFCEVNPIPVKAAVNLMGMKCGTLRKPLTEMEPANLERLKKDMQIAGLL